MHNKQNEKVMDDVYQAWRDHDVERLGSLFHDDATYEDMAMGVTLHGPDGVKEFVNEVYKTMPNFNVTYTKRFATDTHGCGQWVIKATWEGEFEGVDCTGKTVEFTGLSYYEFKDGKILKTQDCWDYCQMMKQFGILSEDLKALK